MKIQESAENYLEAIYVLKKEKDQIRSIDIVRHLEFTKPSVSRAVNLLKTNGYITIDKEGWIELTETGMEIAHKVYERHSFVSAWLTAIGVPADVAAEDACRIEHALSDITFEKVKEFVRNVGEAE
ncbi:MAG: metal-dependent transcriptional regulator [Clostridia bacterium]|nr:metal-dependent transcriptional regulator [Clostridia bacterium]MBR5284144.1 metal-dependent transcriptional regulator [Clostridia bacterium]